MCADPSRVELRLRGRGSADAPRLTTHPANPTGRHRLAETRKVGAVMHLLRHPLTAIFVVLLILFVVFFLLPLVVGLVLHLVVIALIIWVVFALFRFDRAHRRRKRGQ